MKPPLDAEPQGLFKRVSFFAGASQSSKEGKSSRRPIQHNALKGATGCVRAPSRPPMLVAAGLVLVLVAEFDIEGNGAVYRDTNGAKDIFMSNRQTNACRHFLVAVPARFCTVPSGPGWLRAATGSGAKPAYRTSSYRDEVSP